MKRIFIDREKCTGCENCYIACMQSHDNKCSTISDLDLQTSDNITRCKIRINEKGILTPLFCRHCSDADCLLGCMSGALERDLETGMILYDKDKCAACFMCVMNCHYGVLRPDPTASFVIRCDFCIDSDGEPNCVKSCPTKAIFLEEVDK